MDAINTFGAAGSLVVGIGLILFAIISILAPIWIYLIYLNTKKSKEELKAIKTYLSRIVTTLPARTKNCPQCAETIKEEAIKCGYCGHLYPELNEPAGRATALAKQATNQPRDKQRKM